MKRSFDILTATMAAIALGCLVVLSGCGPQNGDPVTTAMPSAKTATVRAAAPVTPAPSFHLGEVRHIETLTERPKGTGVGAATGAVIGGVLGYQVGDGNGQKAATAAGAIGGGLLGNKIERDRKERVVGYNVQVQLDNGQTRTFRRESLSGLTVGSRVKVEGGSLQPA